MFDQFDQLFDQLEQKQAVHFETAEITTLNNQINKAIETGDTDTAAKLLSKRLSLSVCCFEFVKLNGELRFAVGTTKAEFMPYQCERKGSLPNCVEFYDVLKAKANKDTAPEQNVWRQANKMRLLHLYW